LNKTNIISEIKHSWHKHDFISTKYFYTISAPAPEISQLLPTIAVTVEMNADNRSGQHKYFCDIQPTNLTILYRVEWSLTTKLARDLFLHKSSFINFVNTTHFREATALTEAHLTAKGISQLGFTVWTVI